MNKRESLGIYLSLFLIIAVLAGVSGCAGTQVQNKESLLSIRSAGSPPSFVPTDEQRAICVGCTSKLPSWIVVDALEINAIKIDPDRKYALLMWCHQSLLMPGVMSDY